MTAITTAFDRLIDALRDHGSTVIVNGDKATAQCPAHEDGSASLSIGPRQDGKGVVVYCHAGCDYREVLAALGLTDATCSTTAVCAPHTATATSTTIPMAAKCTANPASSSTSPETPRGRALFHADRITADAETVYIPEGEKDVLAAESVGAVAVCSAMGAGKAHKADWSPLAGKHVIIVADKRRAGPPARAARSPSCSTASRHRCGWWRPRSVRICADHIAAGKALDELEPVDGFTPPNNSATAQPRRSQAVPALARLPRILDAVADEVRSRGLVGEERLARTLYLVLTSRLLDKQVSAGVKGHSASGKSYTVETVTRFFPPEAYLEFTAMSERALVYSAEEYAHRTLVVYEVTALREGVEDDMTSYFVRSLLSEGRIDYEVTVRDKEGGVSPPRRSSSKARPT